MMLAILLAGTADFSLPSIDPSYKLLNYTIMGRNSRERN